MAESWKPPPAKYTVQIEQSRFGWWAHRQYGISILTPALFAFSYKRLRKKIAKDEDHFGPVQITRRFTRR